MAQSSARGPYAKGVARRQQIVERALQVFHELGSERTSLRSVAEAMGVTHAAIRHYFGTREQLFLEVLRQADERSRAVLESQRDQGTRGFVGAIARVILGEPGLMSLYTTMIARGLEQDNVESRTFFAERFASMRTDLATLIEEGQRDGTVRTDVDPTVAAALVVAASDGLSTQWLLDRSVDMDAGMRLLDDLLSPRT